MSLRRKLIPVHRWVGLTFGLVVMLSALTGAGLAFRGHLDPVVYPHLSQASACDHALPLDTFVEAARRLHPKGKLDYLRIVAGNDTPVIARFLNKDTLYFDRCTAARVASQNRYAGVFGTLEWLHRGRWLGIGDYVMGSGALALLILLAGVGLFLWWPRKPRRFAQGFTVSTKAKGPAFTIGLHRAVGGWIAIPLLISAVTGLPNAFASIHDAITSLDGPAAPKARSAVAITARLPLADAWTTINRLTPAPREVLIHVAQKPVDPLEIFIIAADAPHANARTYLFLDAYSGRILSFTPYVQMGLGSRIYYWMLSVHTGEVGGWAGQIILFVGAVGAVTLGYTGVSSYLRRRALKKPRKAPQIGTTSPGISR